ncbi:hypothetical protein [Salinicola rhizosphaerae]|uniref:Uncharacterized protein n=1 Tax=Salinicola rhizosphaerae TaxID=1443141 RepID=A0ABQ3EF95_9GAMM|nr:hypothetical protein [Salinicola rhizosphaerae]GHB32773.1 hypothetical protein GCM10009038_34610 [Salinicola rhizosphaerae]
MIRVTLDFNCAVCGHDQFNLPVKREDGQQIRCANCTAYKCHTLDLERALVAMRREPPRTAA